MINESRGRAYSSERFLQKDTIEQNCFIILCAWNFMAFIKREGCHRNHISIPVPNLYTPG